MIRASQPEDAARPIRVEMTARLAEMAGLASGDLVLPHAATLGEVVAGVEKVLERGPGRLLLDSGRLHPSVLVTVDDRVFRPGEDVRLAGDETVRLLLPVAGG